MEGLLQTDYKGGLMATMKDIHEIRRDNLRDILDTRYADAKTPTVAFVADTGVHHTLPAQWLHPEKPRKMGDSYAREIEVKLGLDYGWMDNIHNNRPPEVYYDIILMFEQAYEAERLKLSPEVKAKLLVDLMAYFHPDNPPSVRDIRNLFKIVL